MNPTRTQRFFAESRTWRASFWILSSAAALGLGWLIYRHERSLLVALPLGGVFGALGGTALLVCVDRLRARINGAPFMAGDAVRILSGPYKDHVATVYVVWKNQLRVDLGEEARLEFKDVFSFVEVCREESPAKDAQ